MRIIAGELKSRQFVSPRGRKTHPMSEKARGALFNMLGDITELTMLDAFGGSGALAFEAASRGARFVYCIDSDKKAYKVISENIVKLGLEDKVKGTIANVSSWADNNRDLLFDIIVCDPPYNDLRVDLLQKLADHLEPQGLFVLSWPSQFDIPEFTGLALTTKRNYAGLTLAFFRRSR